METSLHRELKAAYAGQGARLEVPLQAYRIDVVVGSQLIEIQHGSLAAIRRKITELVTSHRVLVVKPIVARKTLVKLDRKDGNVIERRLSPKRGTLADIFHELIYFTRLFPHPNLRIEIPLVDVEEWRFPGHGRRRRWRRNDFQVADEKLVRIQSIHELRSHRDLIKFLPHPMPKTFDTTQLAEHASIPRWVAQRVAYCLRKMGATEEIAKRGNSRVYRVISDERKLRQDPASLIGL